MSIISPKNTKNSTTAFLPVDRLQNAVRDRTGHQRCVDDRPGRGGDQPCYGWAQAGEQVAYELVSAVLLQRARNHETMINEGSTSAKVEINAPGTPAAL